MNKLQMELKKDRDQKQHVRFAEIEEPPKLGKLYMKKSAWEELGKPESLSITITAVT